MEASRILENQIECGTTLHIFNTEKTNTFLKSYGYLASEKEGIRSADMVTENSEHVNHENLVECKKAASDTRQLNYGSDAADRGDASIDKVSQGDTDVKSDYEVCEKTILGFIVISA